MNGLAGRSFLVKHRIAGKARVLYLLELRPKSSVQQKQTNWLWPSLPRGFVFAVGREVGGGMEVW
jgi:hypothetical protein